MFFDDEFQFVKKFRLHFADPRGDGYGKCTDRHGLMEIIDQIDAERINFTDSCVFASCRERIYRVRLAFDLIKRLSSEETRRIPKILFDPQQLVIFSDAVASRK